MDQYCMLEQATVYMKIVNILFKPHNIMNIYAVFVHEHVHHNSQNNTLQKGFMKVCTSLYFK
jgi:hypothetical protein